MWFCLSSTFEWYEGSDNTTKGQPQWQSFFQNTKYFEPSTKNFMINYRVENVEALDVDLQKNGATFMDTIETVDYGKFFHILYGNDTKFYLGTSY
jgi:predicted enzyme related to lactoylglutathione lyase